MRIERGMVVVGIEVGGRGGRDGEEGRGVFGGCSRRGGLGGGSNGRTMESCCGSEEVEFFGEGDLEEKEGVTSVSEDERDVGKGERERTGRRREYVHQKTSSWYARR